MEGRSPQMPIAPKPHTQTLSIVPDSIPHLLRELAHKQEQQNQNATNLHIMQQKRILDLEATIALLAPLEREVKTTEMTLSKVRHKKRNLKTEVVCKNQHIATLQAEIQAYRTKIVALEKKLDLMQEENQQLRNINAIMIERTQQPRSIKDMPSFEDDEEHVIPQTPEPPDDYHFINGSTEPIMPPQQPTMPPKQPIETPKPADPTEQMFFKVGEKVLCESAGFLYHAKVRLFLKRFLQ
jgi:prefoldin subunit 5